jgi:hypothetical protein
MNCTFSGTKPRRLDERPGHVAEQGLGLGIAQDRLRGSRLRHRGEADREQHEQPDEKSAGAAARTESFSHGVGYPLWPMNRR